MTRLLPYTRRSIMASIALCSLAACHQSPPGSRSLPGERPASVTNPNAPALIAAPRDSAAAVAFVLPGSPRENWNVVNSAVQDTIFRFVSANSFDWLRTRSIVRGLALETHLVPREADSTAVIIRGQRYRGKSRREGFTLAGAEHWPHIRSGDADVERLVAEANRIQAGVERRRRAEQEERAAAAEAGKEPPRVFARIESPVGPDSIVRILSDGKLGYCRANTVRVSGHLDTLLIVDMEQRDEWCPVPSYRSGDFRNTFILANPRAVAIRDTISVCWVTGGSRGYRFTVEGWYTNPDRCPYDANLRQRSEPNMVLLRRLP